ncbi:MAG TPA: hypothetical protein VF275_07835 [Gammaproteobacteria bacterium]
MSKKQSIKPIALAISAAFAATAGIGIANAQTDGNTSPFSMTHLSSGYMQDAGTSGDADAAKKGEEGKCGEGKCGEKKGEEGKCGEGKCGEKKGEEGKCGEGKCGEHKDKAAEGSCGEHKDKDAEASCGGMR